MVITADNAGVPPAAELVLLTVLVTRLLIWELVETVLDKTVVVVWRVDVL